MSGMEECTFCCSHDGCNWRPERAVLRKKSTTRAAITTATSLSKTTTTTLSNLPATTQLTNPVPVDSTTLSTASFHASMNLLDDKINSALNGTPPICVDRQPMRIVCQPTLRVQLITAPNFYEPTMVPFPMVEDNDPNFTLSASILQLSSRFPYAFDGSEREIVWRGVDRHGISTTCTTKIIYSTVPLNAGIEKSAATSLSGGVTLSCPEERYVDEHWSVDSMTTTTYIRYPPLQFVERNGINFLLLSLYGYVILRYSVKLNKFV